jgi:hypothetical protein
MQKSTQWVKLFQAKTTTLFVLLRLPARRPRVEESRPLFPETVKGIGAGRRVSHAAVLVGAVTHLAAAHRLRAARLLAAQARPLPAHLLEELVALVGLGEAAVAAEGGHGRG